MRTVAFRRASAVFTLALLGILALGCSPEPDPEPSPAAPVPAKQADKPVRKVEIAQNIYLEVQGDRRRVLVSGSICLQRGALELLMCRKDTKEHEAILTADVDARMLKQALILSNAKEGSPVKFDPKYQPAKGQAIRITVQYEEKGKIVSANTKEWIRNANNKQTLSHDWVFAGSRLIPNPLNPKKTIFLANDGDLVCVSNFESALLDLPIRSTKDASDLVWEANSDKIPPVGTKVTVIFEPIPEKK